MQHALADRLVRLCGRSDVLDGQIVRDLAVQTGRLIPMIVKNDEPAAEPDGCERRWDAVEEVERLDECSDETDDPVDVEDHDAVLSIFPTELRIMANMLSKEDGTPTLLYRYI